jgi:hypothetical protein
VKDKIQGKAEELKGRVTSDRATELKGKARQAVGEAKRLARDLGVQPAGKAREEGRELERSPEAEAREPRPSGPTRPSDPSKALVARGDPGRQALVD